MLYAPEHLSQVYLCEVGFVISYYPLDFKKSQTTSFSLADRIYLDRE